MKRLTDKVALVTGGASGIGEATVRRFVEEGASVVFTDIADGAELADETGSVYLRQDVSDPETWTEVVRSIEEKHGRLDVLVNNAGIVGNQSVVDLDLETFNRVMAINVTGVALGTQAAIASMSNSGGGSIINVASTTSFLGLAFDLAYTASKHAVVGITRSSAAYCAQERLGIRVNTLHPGAIYTAILQGHVAERPELFDVFSNVAPVGRMGDPSEVASMAVYLASDDSSFSTGAQFVVDGGMVNTHPSM